MHSSSLTALDLRAVYAHILDILRLQRKIEKRESISEFERCWYMYIHIRTRLRLELCMYSFHGDRQCISVTSRKGSSKLTESTTLNFVLISLYVTSNGLTVVTGNEKL